MRRNALNRRGGFTIAEGLIASGVLAVTVTAIIAPFSTASRCEHEDARIAVCSFLAKEMMEEILSKPFDDPDGDDDVVGPGGGESGRDDFDNVDDYHGLTENSEGSGIRDAWGNACTDPRASDLVRSVTAEYIQLDDQTVFFDEPTFIRVTVTVTHDASELVELVRLVRKPEED
jgi:MSHA pilin protein MshD